MIVWIASYPRSGNTYLRILLGHHYGIQTYTRYDDELLAGIIGIGDPPVSLERMQEADEPYFVKTHELPADDFPAIYLVRDGRDALVSYAHYILAYERGEKIEPAQEAFHHTLRDLIVHNKSFGGWGPNILAWAGRSAPTAIVKFEELVSAPDPLPIVEQALQDAGYSITSPASPNDHPSFNDLHRQMPQFFRRGKVGGWRSEMPPHLLELFWDIHGEAMQRMEYSLEEQLTFYREQARQRRDLVDELQKQLLEKEKIIHLEDDLLEKSKVLGGLQDRALVEKQEVIRNLEMELLEKSKVVQARKSELEDREKTIWASKQELDAKEKVIQGFRSSYFYWIVNGPFRWLPALRPLANLASNYRTIFLPRIGVLEQYPPAPLNIPGFYAKSPSTTPERGLPSMSIVTPSYNQAEFIERTILSVLGQKYPGLEYVVQDGRSTDETLAVLESFRKDITYFESKPDNGQAHAINLGFQHTSGQIMAYLNSDDMLLPGALRYVADYFTRHPHVDVVYSHRVIVNEDDQEIGRWILPPHDNKVILWADYVPQETLFWRRGLWEKIGGRLDDSYHFALDWDLILRFRAAGAKFKRLPRFLAAFRAHRGQKTNLHIDLSGISEMNRLRKQIHGHDVDWEELKRNIYPYLMRSIVYHKLYRLGVLRY